MRCLRTLDGTRGVGAGTAVVGIVLFFGIGRTLGGTRSAATAPGSPGGGP